MCQVHKLLTRTGLDNASGYKVIEGAIHSSGKVVRPPTIPKKRSQSPPPYNSPSKKLRPQEAGGILVSREESYEDDDEANEDDSAEVSDDTESYEETEDSTPVGTLEPSSVCGNFRCHV